MVTLQPDSAADPMIGLAKLVDERARAIRKEFDRLVNLTPAEVVDDFDAAPGVPRTI